MGQVAKRDAVHQMKSKHEGKAKTSVHEEHALLQGKGHKVLRKAHEG